MQDNAKTNASEEARQRRNARERAKRASETEAQKEERLSKRREKDQARTVLMLFGMFSTIYVLQIVRNHTSSDFARHNCAKRSTP